MPSVDRTSNPVDPAATATLTRRQAGGSAGAVAAGGRTVLARVGAYPWAARTRVAAGDGSPTRAERALLAVHSAAPQPLVLALDLLVLAAVTAAVAGVAATPGAALVVLLGVPARVYADRDTIRCQGVLWYPSRVLLPVTLAALACAAAGWAPAVDAVRVAAVQLAALTALRCLTWLVLVSLRRRGRAMLPTLVVGSGAQAEQVVRKLHAFPEAGLRPVRVLPFDVTVLPEGLCAALRETRAEHVVLLPDLADDVAAATSVRWYGGLHASFSMVPPIAELFLAPASVKEIGGLPLVPLGRPMSRRTAFPGKRAFDVTVAGLLLVLTAPVLAAAALAVKLDDGGPVFYRQRRTGRGGQVFGMVKLRSMVVDAEARLAELTAHNVTDGLLFKMDRDPRVTRVGGLLRRLSVDELPQLWNVVRGEMSLVGPRPLPVDPERFSPVADQRHTARPGITGYWQISGGTGLTYDEMVKLDLAYIQRWSLWLDVRLLLRTVPALLHRHGAY